MPIAPANADGIELAYDTIGDPDGPSLLLVMGLGAQLIVWDDEFCAALADRGFHVIRFDNRDVGLSTKVESDQMQFLELFSKAMQGEAIDAPYNLSNMAADAVSLLDHLGIAAAHVVGASMGGMIAQTMAIEHPDRVLSLTSIMSTTGDRDVGQPTPEAMAVLLRPPATDRDEAIEGSVTAGRLIGSPIHFDEAKYRDRAAASYDRCFYPIGVGRQLLAVVASGSRAEGLRKLDVPTLVVHGVDDPLVTPSGGRRTAELIPGAELLMLDDMGHDLPTVTWAPIVDAITRLAATAAPAP
jgi:pimeloyl-ACP methyl ester carboxylesterase